MLKRLAARRHTLHAFAIGAAWFFVVVSLAHLVAAIGAKAADPGGTFKLYHAVVDGRSHDAWGLTYSGTPGLLQVWVQALVVAAAAAASTLTRPRALRWRRAGLGVLCAWAGLWALNLLWLASVDLRLDSFAQAALMVGLAGCTVYRTAAGWTPRRRLPVAGPMLGAPPTDAGDPGGEAIGPRLRRGVTAARGRAATALRRVADFTGRQADRVGPS